MLVKMLASRNLNKCTMRLQCHCISKQIPPASSSFARFTLCRRFSNLKLPELSVKSCAKELRSLRSVPNGKMFSSTCQAPLYVGAKAVVTLKISPKITELFAEATGDWNPVHFDNLKFSNSDGRHDMTRNDCERSSRSDSKAPIVHGALLNGIVSGVIGTKLPGPGTIVVSQEFRFPAALPVGNQVTVEVEVVSLGRREVNVRYRIVSSEDGVIVMDGTARLMVPKGKIS